MAFSNCYRNDIYYLHQFKKNRYRTNHRLLQMLGVSNVHLDKICKLAQKHGFSGKCTEFGNGRYVYIWYTYANLIFILMNELKTRGFACYADKFVLYRSENWLNMTY